MTNENKPTSKAISVSSTQLATESGIILNQFIICCEDGSIWRRMEAAQGESIELSGWQCILEATKPLAPTITIPGTWWKKINGKQKVQVSGVYVEGPKMDIAVSYSDEQDCHDEELETFMKIFEPLEANTNAK